MADNKVNFLRGTSAEYEAATKNNDTFYYTTDDGKLYLGDKEITGIEIDDTSTIVTDKTWSAKKISEHTDNSDIHVTTTEKNNWNGKVDSNQGASNAGKLLGTNSSGDVVAIQGYGFEYNEETKMLEYGTDPTTNINQGIGLDNTLSKKGYAAEASAVGELKSDLDEQLSWNITPTYIDNKMVYWNNGYQGTVNDNSITDFIEIPNGVKTIYIKNCKGVNSGNDNRGSYFYTSNTENKGIANSGVQMKVDGTEDIVLNVPNGAKYFRATVLTDKKDSIKYYFGISESLLDVINRVNSLDFQKPFYTSLSVFESMGVIGDSFASGEIYVNGQGHDYYNLSWGQILARQYGVQCKNFSTGGLTTRSWLTSEIGLPNLLGSNPRKIYFLALGINDYYSLGINYLGNISDIKEDFTQNADTFYGNYGKIIGNIKAHAPNAKMVMFTLATISGVAPQFSQAIINIANHFGIPYIVQRDDNFFTSSFYTSFVNGHPVAITYSGMAQAFARLLDKCMQDNYDYFKDYVG